MTSPSRRSERRPVGSPLVLLLCLGPWACASDPPLAGATPYTPPGPVEEEPIGYYLSQMDAAIRAWTNLKLDSRGEQDQAMLRGLEADLRYKVTRRQEEIVEQLESGPPKNRSIAAVALGFSGDPAVLSPLLAAVGDTDSEIANNALLGIGVLADPETPLTQIAWILANHRDPWVRVNAAFAIQRIVAVGGRADVLPAACRQALTDDEPGVRAQGAAILGLLNDEEAIVMLGDLLFDEENLVAAAAAASLGRIGRSEAEHKGTVARLLVDAMERREGPVRLQVHRELDRLHEGDLGEDPEPWREWAYRLP